MRDFDFETIMDFIVRIIENRMKSNLSLEEDKQYQGTRTSLLNYLIMAGLVNSSDDED